MTDRSRFELLATSVLRKADSNYSAIVQTGLNARGETIVSPIDGIHLVPHSNPPHYVFVQHTTTDRDRLREKWLTGENADLPKAVNEAKETRREVPKAKFTVVLCTNQRLDKDLVKEVTEAAVAEEVDVDIWGQDRIADFLDTTTDGHWLRKIYLGVEVERLSEDLLRELCRQSVEKYRREILLPDHNPLVHRENVDHILGAIGSDKCTLCFVRGESGYGKSTACLQAVERRLGTGLLAIWLPARYVQNATTIESALDAWLRTLHPTLEPDAGRLAMALSATAGHLVVVVDDINRTLEPARIVRSLVGSTAPWGSEAPGSGSKEPDRGKYPVLSLVLVVPVWADHLRDFSDPSGEKAWVRVLSVGEMSPEECSQVIRAAAGNLSEAEALDFAGRLGHDPFLVGRFASMVAAKTDRQEMTTIAEDVIREFIERQISQLALGGPAPLLPAEFREVLKALGQQMLLQRNLQPDWTTLRKWFGNNSRELNGLRVLVQDGHLCRLDTDDRVLFRHDRLRDRVLVDAMDALMRMAEPPEDVIFDPFFASFTGQAVARVGHRQDWVSRLRSFAPLALFEAIRHFGEPSGEHHRRIFEEAQAWAANESRQVPESLRWAVSWTLLETSSSQILPLIDAMEPNHLLRLAGFRNGSATHGVKWLKAHLRHGFEPMIRSNFRDQIMEHVSHHFSEKSVDKLGTIVQLECNTSEDAAAVLTLLGFLRLGGFENVILQLWSNYPEDVLPHALWATARCPVSDVAALLGPMLDRLASMPKRETPQDTPSRREWIVYDDLRWAFHGGITEEAIKFLLMYGRTNESCVHDVRFMLEYVDHPDAVEFVVRQMGDWFGADYRSSGLFIGGGELKAEPLPSQVNNRLKHLWDSASESDIVRKWAFSIWLGGTACRDLALLRTIDQSSPLFLYALQHRVKLGDTTAVEEILGNLRSGSHGFIWWSLAHHIWCDKLRDHTAMTLESLKGTIPEDFSGGRTNILYQLADLLVMIPPQDAEPLLEANWDHLKFSPKMVHAAWRIGTAKCVTLLAQGMAVCPANTDVFEHAHFLWNRGHHSNPVSLQHLENLVPYLDRISEKEIKFLAWEAERARDPDGSIGLWSRQNFLTRLPPEERLRVRVADEFLIGQFDHYLKNENQPIFLDHIFERVANRSDFRQRELGILESWFASNQTLRSLMVVAECLKNIGTRNDLKLLSKYSIDGEPATIEKIKTDAEFFVKRRSLA